MEIKNGGKDVIYSNVLELIGNTPLVALSNIARECKANVVAKLEFFNPGGSIKDRIARQILVRAREQGKINNSTLIIEATSGNTGIGLALVCAVMKLKLLIVMPANMSLERQRILKALGAELVLTPPEEGMSGAVEKALKIAKEHNNTFLTSQFENLDNVEAHYLYTAEEIWQDTEGKIDIFVAGVGSGGTITGVGKRLKEYNPEIAIYAVEPVNSPVLSGGQPGLHAIQGIGAGFVPEILDTDLIDGVIKVQDEDALDMAAQLIRKEGIMAGISSGANCVAALSLAKKKENAGKMIVFPACDTAERYLSTSLFDGVENG
ncbi:MAG: cysteine synthase A [Desulfonauticus sp.]|nr:cysteine synthase A [Desulfonauticus sp.]